MECQECHRIKLSKEFPPVKLTDKCSHTSKCCIRCVLKHWDQYENCLLCKEPIEKSSYALNQCHIVLQKLFPEVTCQQDSDAADGKAEQTAGQQTIIPTSSQQNSDEANGKAEQTITITGITGEVLIMDFHPTMTVFDLQEKITRRTGIETEHQDLFFKNQRMKIYKEFHRKYKVLSDDYGVGPNSNIYLRKLVQSFDPHLKDVTFHINWNHKKISRIFLDLTIDCFRDEGQECIKSINHVTSKISKTGQGSTSKTRQEETSKTGQGETTSKTDQGTTSNTSQKETSRCFGIKHSGDRIDDNENTGAQEANISLHDVPKNIDYIFFTLSRYNAKGFPDSLEFKFYEESSTDQMLYTETIKRKHDQQAIVLCALVRDRSKSPEGSKSKEDMEDKSKSTGDRSGHWLVYSYNKPCDGHINRYKPVITTIQDIIKGQSTSGSLGRVEYQPTQLGKVDRSEISFKRIWMGINR